METRYTALYQCRVGCHCSATQLTYFCCTTLFTTVYCISVQSPEARDGQITLLSHQLQQKQPCHGQHNKHDDDHHHDGNDEDNYYDDPL